MSENDFESQVLSGDEEAGGEKLVPVSEAIRYRKRAQSAEKEMAELQQRLNEQTQENSRVKNQLAEARLEQELTAKLLTEKVNDIEAAVLMAKARIRDAEEVDIDNVVEQLKKEKGYLFGELGTEVVVSKTSGIKEKNSGSRVVLESLAQAAAGSGKRTDVQEYMRARRQFV